ncbi:MAG: OmpA family protein [Myxococcaceae bacterium]
MESTQQPARTTSSATPWILFGMTLVALGAVVYFGWQILSADQKRAESAERTVSDATVKMAELDASNHGLRERVRALEEEKTNLSDSMTELSENLKEAEAELARLKATADSLEEKLKAEIQKGEIRVSQVEGRIKVDLVDKVLFDSGEAELSARGAEVLSRVANVLSRMEDRRIQVSGHTDNAPIVNALKNQYPTNWELSAARAVNVVRHLAEKGGVSPKRLVAAGHGEFEPVVTNATPKGRAQNRRIEILLIPELKKGKRPAVKLATEASKR